MGVLPAKVWTSDISFPEPDKGDYDLLESLECPDHLNGLELYDEEVWDSFCQAHHKNILFHLEQCCDSSGILLSQEIRETKLQTAPLDEQRDLENFIRETDVYVLGQVTYFVFWLVRFERARRTGSAELALLE